MCKCPTCSWDAHFTVCPLPTDKSVPHHPTTFSDNEAAVSSPFIITAGSYVEQSCFKKQWNFRTKPNSIMDFGISGKLKTSTICLLQGSFSTFLTSYFSSKKLVLQSDFVNSIEGSWLGWSANMFIGKPARWAYNSLVTGSEKIPPGSYIHQGVLEVVFSFVWFYRNYSFLKGTNVFYVETRMTYNCIIQTA